MRVLSIVLLSALVCAVSCATTGVDLTTEATTPAVVHDRRERLIQMAAKLMKEADDEIKILTSEGKTSAIDVLKKEEAHLKTLIDELEKTPNDHHLALVRIEVEVQLAEARLRAQIKRDVAHNSCKHCRVSPATVAA